MKSSFILFFLTFVFACSNGAEKETLKIACAANMQFAMDSIVDLFEDEQGIVCETTYGSSGMLTAQIENGAPYDLFFSANAAYPDHLYDLEKGEQPFNYAKGRLLFVYPKIKQYQSVERAMMDESIQRIGLADNRTAPYGMAADAFLEAKNLKTNRLDKLVVGESIGQVNQYIVTGAVDVAFTSYAFKIKHGDDYGYIEVDQSFFDPILQNAMVITNQEGVSSEAAKKMVDYIQSSKIKAVLNYFGYFTD